MYKDILVHLDGGDRDPLRIAAARGIAERFAGRLTGLYVASPHHDRDDAEASAAQFAEATAGSSATMSWRRHDRPESGRYAIDIAVHGRLADLIVLGQHHAGKSAREDLIAQVIQRSGRPTLVLPSVGAYPMVGSSVVIAWDGSREAARALHAAMPMIVGAGAVEVVTVGDPVPSAGSEPAIASADLLDHLAAHGVAASCEVLPREDIGVMDLLLSRAFDQGADLLVMGAHPGPQHLHFFRGAGTRYVLDHMTLPVLMAG
ncbi:universal stress protein [Pinisolibacter sp.]|uniref:universal stress protein n=1 Tax=Pinisolibacter sp. TaxID=2172024 RepID=UPI002FDDA53D